MKMTKRILAMLLALVMVFAMAACNQTKDPTPTNNDDPKPSNNPQQTTPEKDYYNKTGLRICDNPITITVSGIQGYTNDWNNNAMTDFFRDELGIVFDCTPYQHDAFASQYALMLANNEQPDLLINMQNFSKEQVDMDGAAGYWLDFSQYLDIMPNFVSWMEKNPEWADYMKTDTGAIYGINWFVAADVSRIGGNIYISKANLDAAGVSYDIKTLDDFYNALVKLKAAFPEKITLGITPDTGWTGRAESILRSAFGINHINSNYMLDWDANGQAFLHDITDNNREYLKFMNKLYEEGILDPECFIRTPDEYRAKEYSGEIAVFSDSGFDSAQHGAPNSHVWIAALTTDAYPETSYTMSSPVVEGVKCVVKADTEYPEAICRLIDYMFTEEGKWLGCGAGVEGVTFEWVENKYNAPIYSQDKYADLKNYETVSDWYLQKAAIIQALQFFNGADRMFFADLTAEQLEEMAADPDMSSKYQTYAYQQLAVKGIQNFYTAANPSSYSEDVQQERTTLYTDISTYIKTMNVSFITGELNIEDDAAWENFINTLKSMNYDRLMAIETAAHSG